MEKNRDGNDKFIYSYSAKQQMEIEKIREKYLPKKENKLDELRKIDGSVTRKGTLISISFGIMSSLVFGLGLYFTIEEKASFFLPGIIIGLIGLAGIGGSLPLNTYILKRERKKVSARVLKLSEELMNSNE